MKNDNKAVEVSVAAKVKGFDADKKLFGEVQGRTFAAVSDNTKNRKFSVLDQLMGLIEIKKRRR